MEFSHLLKIVGDEPIFETGLLLAGEVDAADVRRQLSRWVKTGRLYQLRRGLYALAPPFQKVKPHPFLVANRLARGSYVSPQSALAHHSLIPEAVPVTMSVSAMRPARWDIPLGVYKYRHVKTELLSGYQLTNAGSDQHAFVATAEKALLDLEHLQPQDEAMVIVSATWFRLGRRLTLIYSFICENPRQSTSYSRLPPVLMAERMTNAGNCICKT